MYTRILVFDKVPRQCLVLFGLSNNELFLNVISINFYSNHLIHQSELVWTFRKQQSQVPSQ